MFNGV